MGYLDQYAGAVTHGGIGPDGAAMVEILQNLQPGGDHLPRLPALDIGHKADTA
jgi:hypothetical protein